VSGGFSITSMLPEHAEEVLTIYRLGIDEGNATFETAAPTRQVFDAAKLENLRNVALGARATRAWQADHRRWQAPSVNAASDPLPHPDFRG
jgi:phosphinothricin acetyltransferase